MTEQMDDFKKKITPDFFESSEKVLEVVSSIKWKQGFSCRNCGHENYCDGKTPYARRCTRCKKEESATAHTLFHNIKFPVNKAFYIAWQVCVEKKDTSSYNYAEKLGINQMTCWKFRKRITQCVERMSDIQDDKKLQHILLSYEKQ